MNLNEIAEKAEKFARDEIEKYWLPWVTHFNISLEKWIKIAEELGANVELVKIWVCLMDVKLWQAFSEKRVWEHIKMSSDATKDFLKDFEIDEQTKNIIIECVEWHHWKEKFDSLEAEITANADCYRFISPKGIFYFFTVLWRRLWDNLEKNIENVENKMDEKMNIVSLDLVKEELEPIYKNMKNYFNQIKEHKF